MNRKIKVAVIITSLLVASTSFAQGRQGEPNTSNQKALDARVVPIKIKGALGTGTPTTTKDRVIEKRNQFLVNQVDRMIKQFENTIERLENIAEKIESRIEKMKANGLNVLTAETALQNAKSKISLAKTSLGNLSSASKTFLSSTDPKTAFKDLRALFDETKNKIREAHKALVNTINTLKPGTRPILNETSSTTGTTTKTQ